MSESAFNVQSLLNAVTEDANSTELLPVPEAEYTAISEPITEESFQEGDIKRGDRAGQKWLCVNVTWLINDEGGALKELLGRSPKVRQKVFLDMSPGGGLDFGKGRNVALGQLREALGQNGQGRPWNFAMLGSQVAKINVKNRLLEDTRTVSEVVGVTKA